MAQEVSRTNSEKSSSEWAKRSFIQIDESGHIFRDGEALASEELGHFILQNLKRDERGRFFSLWESEEVWVEAFDEPLIAQSLARSESGLWQITMPYGFVTSFSPYSLCLDDWDRFHGYSENGAPFVLTNKAQEQFFDLLDEFDDDSITVDGERIPTPHWLLPRENSNPNREEFWSGIYQTETPGWELEAPSKPLVEVLPQLKLNKLRVIVLGCGSGNDAAHFAEQGHIVLGVDLSEEAIARAKKKYSHIENLEFLTQDMFALGAEHNHQYDLVFEHTCFCAIHPERRNELVNLWKRLLTDDGQVLGVFFTWDRREGPPFGGSEWEIRERLKNGFQMLYWTRWRHSLEHRQAHELVVLAKRSV